MEEKTLDLSGLTDNNFLGSIKLRHLHEWAEDYWRQQYKLARIILTPRLYKDLEQDILKTNMYVRLNHSKLKTVDLGFGPVEIIGKIK